MRLEVALGVPGSGSVGSIGVGSAPGSKNEKPLESSVSIGWAEPKAVSCRLLRVPCSR